MTRPFAFVLLLTALGATDATAQMPRPRAPIKGRAFSLKVDSSPQQAAVYWDIGTTPAPKDFGIAGYTPITLKVPRGNVRLVIELKGFRPQERDVDVARNNQALTVTLERVPQPAHLEVVAANDGGAVGADVSIDGVGRGTLPNTFEVAAGRHDIEVRKAGWKPLAKWVDLAEDERRTMEVVLDRDELPPGTLLVTADVSGDVYVDGARKDVAPAVITGLGPGEHVVEVRRAGAAPWRQTVTIASGQQSKVNANLGLPASPQPAAGGAGAQPVLGGRAILRVQSTVPDAEVFLDGSTLGKAPVDRRDLEPGRHYVTVRKDGYQEFKREVDLVDLQSVALVADLRAVGKVRFLSNPQGADVTIDGEPVGHTPVAREDVPAGDHVFLFRLNGYYDHKETISVIGGKERLVSADLKVLPTGPTPEQVARRKAGMSSFGARALPTGGFTADLGVGYPNILMARLTVGAFTLKPGGLDLGIEILTYFQMSMLSLHSRLQLATVGPLSVAVRGNIGGGAGVNGRNTFFFDAAAIAALDFADVVTFSADLRFAYWSDQFCPSAQQVANGVGQEDYCKTASTWLPEFGNNDPAGRRFGASRLYAGLTAVAAIDERLSVFARLDFLPLAGILTFPPPRYAYEGKFNSIMFEHDPLYYGTVGVSLKF